MQFEVLARAGAARRARLTLAHGTVETPVFMPVGTYGAVKAMSPADLEDISCGCDPERRSFARSVACIDSPAGGGRC